MPKVWGVRGGVAKVLREKCGLIRDCKASTTAWEQVLESSPRSRLSGPKDYSVDAQSSNADAEGRTKNGPRVAMQSPLPRPELARAPTSLLRNRATDVPFGAYPYLCVSADMEVTPPTAKSKGGIG